MRFYCNRCPTSFNQFKKLVEHYEANHNPCSEKYEKFKDDLSYHGTDSGCKAATEFLGHPSSCLKCPFRKCVFDELYVGVLRAKKRRRNEEIIQRWKQDESIADLAIAFDVSKRTIQRVVKRKDG